MKPEARHDPLLGSVLEGRYRLVSVLGRGGMGSVYVAEETRLGRRYALKVLKPELAEDRAQVERFLREAQTIARLEHPNIVDIHSFGEDPSGLVFFTMELLTGEDLESRISARAARPYGFREACNWAIQIARAVGVVHEGGLIHRDLKTQNVFLARARDGSEIIKLLDFGIARPEEGSELTRTGNVLGTPSYMSPEQVRNDRLDRRTDIYSFGVLLFKLLTGRPPFVGEAIQVAMQHLTSPPPQPSMLAPASDIPPALDELVLTAMSKQPDDRHDSMATIQRALAAVLNTPVPAAVAPPSSPKLAPPRPALTARSEVRLAPPAPPLRTPSPSPAPTPVITGLTEVRQAPPKPPLPSAPAPTGTTIVRLTEVREAAPLLATPAVAPTPPVQDARHDRKFVPVETVSIPPPASERERPGSTEVRLAQVKDAAVVVGEIVDDEVTARSVANPTATETAFAPVRAAPAPSPTGSTRRSAIWHLIGFGASLLALLALAVWLVTRDSDSATVMAAAPPDTSHDAPASADSIAGEPVSAKFEAPKDPLQPPESTALPIEPPAPSPPANELVSPPNTSKLEERPRVKVTPESDPRNNSKTAPPPADPIARIKERARTCRRKHRATGQFPITVEYAIGSDGSVMRATPSSNTPLAACLAEAVKQARFEPKIRLRQEITL